MITSLGLKTVRILKRKKNSRYAINNVSLRNISKIIKGFEKFPYEGYVRKSSKHEPTHGYFYLARNIDMCKMRLNSHIGPVRTQSTNTQNMNNYKMSAQKTPNSHACSTDKSESKRVIANACSLGKCESKSVYISVNMKELKDKINETKDEEPSLQIIQSLI